MICNSTDSEIFDLWSKCSQEYIDQGINIQFPKHTDPRKTYMWRYLVSILKKFDAWGLTDRERDYFIHLAVGKAKELKLIHKGLSILHQSNIMDLCYKQLNDEKIRLQADGKAVIAQHKWLMSQISNNDPVEILSKKTKFGRNIILWYNATKISDLYIALSVPCKVVIDKLDSGERSVLPKKSKLYWLRSKFLEHQENKQLLVQVNKFHERQHDGFLSTVHSQV